MDHLTHDVALDGAENRQNKRFLRKRNNRFKAPAPEPLM